MAKVIYAIDNKYKKTKSTHSFFHETMSSFFMAFIFIFKYIRNFFSNALQDLGDILNTGTDCGFCPPLPLGEGWGEGFQKNANRDRSKYI